MQRCLSPGNTWRPLIPKRQRVAVSHLTEQRNSALCLTTPSNHHAFERRKPSRRKMFRNLPGFKSIPSAIGLPFLSSSEDAQLKFRSSENGIKRLYSDNVIPLSDFEYWAQYYTLFNSAQDVYSLISVQDGECRMISHTSRWDGGTIPW